MKKFKNILKDIEKTNNDIKELEKREKEISRNFENIKNFKAYTEAKKPYQDELKNIDSMIYDLKIKKQLLYNNSKVSLFNEVVPTVCEVLKKYNGKPYGEKTKEKIRKEISEKTSCYFWIENRFSQSYHITYFQNNVIAKCEIVFSVNSASNNPLISNDNKLYSYDFNDLHIIYEKGEYITNIPARIKKLKVEHEKAIKAQKELEKTCSKFNDLTVDGIPQIYKTQNIYSDMLIKCY